MASRRVPLIELLKSAYPERPEKELLALIMRGDVRVNGEPAEKPGVRFAAGANLSLRQASPFVSRGGEKLAHALDTWKIDARRTVWIDAGCSTGGFTDCLLSRGASLVYAVDVGINQLDWRLRSDERVRVMEGTNITKVVRGRLDPVPHSAVADLSFRSLRKVAAHILGLTREGWGIFLVKPQFEWASPSPEFRGVVRNADTVLSIVEELSAGLEAEGMRVEKALLSPLRGRKGNRELLFLLRAGKTQPGDVTRRVLEKLILE